MHRNQPLVSIVTPVYNGAGYLRECIDSVLSQTYQNWEYVILDNASTDATPAILDEYATRDARIRIHRNETLLPVIKNHNAALRLLSPDAGYCKPLMADDWLFPECVEKMVAAAEADASVGLVCAWAFDGRNVLWDGWPYPALSVSGREVARANLLDDDLYIFGSPTSTLLRTDIVRARPCFYSEDNIAGDYEACLEVLQTANFSFVHQVLTFQRMHAKSVTSAHANFEGGFVGRVLALNRWGPVFLSADEFQSRYQARMKTYYQLLAWHALHLAGTDFWRYHRAQLAKMGATLDKGRLLVAILRRISGYLLSPLDTLRRLVWKFT